MESQRTLFAEMDEPRTEPELRGFRYQDEFVTPQEEAALAASLAQLDLKPFEFHGHLGSRRVISFGLRYDYDRRSVEAATEMPSFLNDLRLRAAEFAGCEPDTFRQVGINEYRTGAPIGWHKDKSQFGIVVGVSLLASAVMRFRRAEGSRWIRTSRTLQPRSIYLLSEDARTVWEHSIPPQQNLRYSINFRTLSRS